MPADPCSVETGLTSGARDQVDELPGAPNESKPDERRANAILGLFHRTLAMPDHAEVHEARGSQRYRGEQPGDRDGGSENGGEEGDKPAGVHGEQIPQGQMPKKRAVVPRLVHEPATCDATARVRAKMSGRVRV